MPFRLSPLLAVVIAGSCAAIVTAVAIGCSSDDTGGTTGAVDAAAPRDGAGPTTDGAITDGGTDSLTVLPDAAAFDAACPKPKVAPATGETCIGFGKGMPCDPACGLPQYGYVCFNGGPPGFAGCVQASASSLGETYCCPDDKCVPQPDQDTKCSSGTPHRYQCPPNVMPPAGCGDGGSGGSNVERFYCCP